jgi:arginyl-tRNA synthetase
MLSFQGNTAPYLQNAYVRIQSIFRKAAVAAPLRGASLILAKPVEKNLARRLCQFAETVPTISQ